MKERVYDEDNNDQTQEGNSMVINKGKILEASLMKDSFTNIFEE